MAGEFVPGIHGELDYNGTRLAGLWPRAQMEPAAEAGATVFCPAVAVNAGKSCAWNVARALAIVKSCASAGAAPIHMDVGMRVGAVPITDYAPVDAVSCVSRACVDILHLDGLLAGGDDMLGMPCADSNASATGGMRASGDPVARMEMTRGLRVEQAKQYVAGKPGTWR